MVKVLACVAQGHRFETRAMAIVLLSPTESTLVTRLNLLVSGFYLTLGLGSRITLLSQGLFATHLVTRLTTSQEKPAAGRSRAAEALA